jgi:ferredoxin
MEDSNNEKKLKIDTDLCSNCGTCYSVYPDVFEPTEDGKARVKKKANLQDKEMDDLTNICPTGAIKYE